MQKHAEDGAAALGIENYCRLDFMMRKDGRMYCLEANTLPGMTPTSLLPQEAAVLGMNFGELCEKLIEAVSYTHLDVYKRQPWRSITATISLTLRTMISSGL